MNERKTIVYAGGFALPDRNASAQRALENSRLFRSLGYEVVLVGQLPQQDGKTVHEMEIDGLRCFNIHAPDDKRSYGAYKRDPGAALAVMEALGPSNIYAFLGYNYPSGPLARILKYNRSKGIPTALELTEWYSWEGPSVIKNLERGWDTQYRIRVLAHRAGNILCTSDWGRRRYRTENALTLPWIVDETAPKWTTPSWPRAEGRRRFVYAGNPGKGLIKDFLHVAIAALADFARKGADFDFQVAGISKADVLAAFPRLAGDIEALGDRITFHGRLPHAQTLGLVKSADFSFFVRPDNRMSHFGFPTKLAEAFACGTPTITNPTSDIARYVRDGDTGILLAGPDAGSIAEGLGKALALSDDEVAAMRARCAADNPFSPAKFAGPVAAFLEAVR